MSGRVVVLTGATGGIGGALAEVFAGESLMLLGRNSDRLASMASGYPGARTVAADLTDAVAVADAVNGALEPGERVDVLVHNAGVAPFGPVAETTHQDWALTLAVNVTAPAVLTAALLPRLRAARGHVVFIGSGQSLSAAPRMSAYAASKFALRALADSLRAEEREAGIRVTSVYPGQTATPMQEQLQRHYGRPYRAEDHIDPRSLAATVRFVVDSPRDADFTDITVRPGLR
jgi:NADP-dependent 3-hydroxy acid dehydrogenase YdfG